MYTLERRFGRLRIRRLRCGIRKTLFAGIPLPPGRKRHLRSRETYGRGAGVGRGLGTGDNLGIAVVVAVGVGVTVAVAVAVSVGVGVTDGVGVGVVPCPQYLPPVFR